VFGIRIRVQVLILILVGVMVLADFAGDAEAGVRSLAFYGTLFLAVLFHEFGHCYAAAHFGARPREVMLWLLGGISRIEDSPQQPGPEIAIAFSGPFVNLVLACLLLAGMAIAGMDLKTPFSFHGLPLGGIILKSAFLVNALLFLFNLIPALPLDGGAILRWSLVGRQGYAGATRTAAFIGQAAAVAMGLSLLILRPDIGVSFFVLIVALFIFLECERQKKLARDLEEGSFHPWAADEEAEFASYTPPPPPRPSFFERLRARREARKRETEVREEVEMRERVDQLLDKISRLGLGALSEKEKAFLREASKRFGNRRRS
jgi:Zn-dependent protease